MRRASWPYSQKYVQSPYRCKNTLYSVLQLPGVIIIQLENMLNQAVPGFYHSVPTKILKQKISIQTK